MQIPDILKNKWVQLTSVAVVALATGGVGGYILGTKKKTFRIELPPQSMQLSIFETESEKVVAVIENDPVLEVILEDQKIIENKKDIIPTSTEDEEIEVEKVNVFTIEDGDWDWESELSDRKSYEPYVIHQEEFISDEMGYRQETLTYYAGDDIMADDSDTPIYNYTGMMGELKFGHGSKDKNVVYIRNEQIHMEWEILRHQGTFEEEVLGLSMEKDADKEDQIRHSVQKFRRE